MKVAIIRTVPEYPPAPFSPSEDYPEYKFDDKSSTKNYVYEAVRNLLIHLELDEKGFGTPKWNPLRSIVRPGDNVVIKPNMVSSVHFGNGEILSVITHASIIRAIIDYILIALNGNGEIIIGDSPERVADFKKILEASGIQDLIYYYKEKKINIQVRDFRREKIKYGYGAIVQRTSIKGDPEGYTIINIGEDSAFYGLPKKRLDKLYGADYDRRETLNAHYEKLQKYEIANTVLQSDVVISIPKFKVHKKAGVTLNLKGFIGATGNKNLIPHRALGDPSTGGDSYPFPAQTMRGHFARKLRDFLKDNLLGTIKSKYSALAYGIILKGVSFLLRVPEVDLRYGGGEWHGNDILWRSVADIARILHHTDKEGCLLEDNRRRFFSIIDGIYAGDKQGPMEPRVRKEGILIGGANQVAVDLVATSLMGFDFNKIKYLKNMLEPHRFNMSIPIESLEIVFNDKRYINLLKFKRDETLMFEPVSTWAGKIEFDE